MKNKKPRFTMFDDSTNWVEGYYGDRRFQAKLYDEDSPYGINNGRVSKLHIEGIADYERGWDVKPESIDAEIYDDIMDLLENSPKRFG